MEMAADTVARHLTGETNTETTEETEGDITTSGEAEDHRQEAEIRTEEGKSTRTIGTGL